MAVQPPIQMENGVVRVHHDTLEIIVKKVRYSDLCSIHSTFLYETKETHWRLPLLLALHSKEVGILMRPIIVYHVEINLTLDGRL